MATFYVNPDTSITKPNQVVTVELQDDSFVDGGSTSIEVYQQSDPTNKITIVLTHDGVTGSKKYKGHFTVKDKTVAVTDDVENILAVGYNDIIELKYDAGGSVTAYELVYSYDYVGSVTLDVSPGLAWGQNKAITVKVTDSLKSPSETIKVNVYEEGNTSNKIVLDLSYNYTGRYFEGVFYVTNTGTTSGSTLVLSGDTNVVVEYGNKTTTVVYTVDMPKDEGYYVEVRSSVRNLHWDLVTILTKAGWNFVETIPPKVDTNGYVTEFKHVLKTTTTPREVDGEYKSLEMYLLIEHKNYPGDNSGNYQEITFKLSPNYYYHDESVFGKPDTKSSDVLFDNGAGIYKVFEYPSPEVSVLFIPENAPSVPFVLDVPVNIWGYVSRDFFSLVLQGDPSIADNGFGQVSHIYVGVVESFKEGKTDIGGNFAIAGTARTSTGTQNTRYGPKTSDGVRTIAMYRTYGGLLWQAHYPSILYDDPQGENQKSELYQPSVWTGKFHLSPIYVYHPIEGKRGFLKSTLSVYKQGILHLDELEIIRPVDECNPCPKDSQGNPIDPNDTDHPEWADVWKKEKYKYFRLSGGTHFLSSYSINDQYKGIGIAIKMETDPDKIIKFNTSYDIVTGRGVTSWQGIGSVPEGAKLAGARTAPMMSSTVRV